MLRVARELTRARIAYYGPRDAVMELCYDKLRATRLAEAEGIACPRTMLGDVAAAFDFPLIVKPRRGSDSIGLRLLRKGPLPARYRTSEYLVQEVVRGLINWLVTGLIEGTIQACEGISNAEEVRTHPQRVARFTPETARGSAATHSGKPLAYRKWNHLFSSEAMPQRFSRRSLDWVYRAAPVRQSLTAVCCGKATTNDY